MMHKRTAVLVEDEKELREGFKALLAQFCPQIEVIGEAGSKAEALNVLEKLQPEILFLDVELPDGTGLEVAQSLPRHEVELIFVTAYEKYALDALKLASIGYLLKPVDPLDLQEAVGRAEQSLAAKESARKLETLLENLGQNRQRKIVLRDQESLHVVPVKDIYFIKADGSYCHFFLKGGRSLTISSHIKPYESALAPVFFRVHNSFLVNLGEVSRFDKQEGGRVVMSDGQEVPVSRRRKDDFLARLQDLF